MKSFLTFIIISMLFVSGCSTLDKGNEVVHYESLGNDVAFVKLSLFESERFLLTLNPLEGKKTNFKGNWAESDGKYILTFTKNVPDFYSLFIDFEGVQVEGRDKIVFSSSLEKLWIWGIYCDRKNLN